MAYLTELDDLRSHVVYPPRGMEFAPAHPADQPAESPQEPKPLWRQEELSFAPANDSPDRRPSA